MISFYDRELDRARTSPSLVNMLFPLSPVKMSQGPNTQNKAHQILTTITNMRVISGLCCVIYVHVNYYVMLP